MLLITGMLLGQVQYTVIVGIAGFLLMFGSVVYLFWAGSGSSGPRGTVAEDGSVRAPSGRGGKSNKASGPSFVARMEERFRRRFP